MRRWLRKVRGALGIAFAWAASWAVAEVAIVSGLVLVFGGPLSAGMIAALALSGAIVGFLGGLGFSAVFGALNRRRTLDEIRVGSTALLGAAAGGIVPALLSLSTIPAGLPSGVAYVMVNLAIGAIMGTATAVGLVRIARWGGPELAAGGGPDSALPPESSDEGGRAAGG